jgi:hypothetical protein
MRNTLLYTIYFSLIFSLPAFTGTAQKCGVLTFAVTVLDDITTGTSCKGHFEANATFNSTAPDFACRCCEFRQKIKGSVSKDGNKLTVKLLGPVGPPPHPEFLPDGAPTQKVNLSETTYQEDYADYGDGPGRYGHRSTSTFSEDNYKKGGSGADADELDAAGGCKYYMSDKPGIDECDPKHSYKVDLYFEDKIITTCELCDGCRAIETHIVAERPAAGAPNPPAPPAPPPKKGIGPDTTSLLVFLSLAAGWIILTIRREYRTA